MEQAVKYGMMDANILGYLKMERKMEMENLFGQIKVTMKEIGIKIKQMDMGYLFGQIK